jgi:serine/threonine-protein kinase
MLTGSPPFRGDTVQSVLEMHRSALPRDPCTISPHVSQPLGRIVLRTLDKDPARRPQNAAELAAALRAVPEGR